MKEEKRLLFLVSEDWYFVSHRLHLAINAIKSGYKVALLSRISRHHDLLVESGIEVIDWPLNRSSRNIWTELRAIKKVFSTIREFKPDLVHAVAAKPMLYTALACRFTGVKSRVFALGGLGFVFSSQERFARLVRPLLVKGFKLALSGVHTRLILQNPDDRNVLLSVDAIDADRIRMIRGAGVDASLFVPKEESLRQRLVVLPARMLWNKGVGEFVECATALREKDDQVRFALVGVPDSHNPESVPEEQLKHWNREGTVEWWGRRDDMPEVYQQASIVCLPTSYGEGLPKSLIEAASCECPIVTYDVSGCREIVVHGVNGVLVPFQDQEALLASIERLLDDADLRTRMGQTGRKMVLNEFTQEKIAEETLQVWEDVLK